MCVLSYLQKNAVHSSFPIKTGSQINNFVGHQQQQQQIINVDQDAIIPTDPRLKAKNISPPDQISNNNNNDQQRKAVSKVSPQPPMYSNNMAQNLPPQIVRQQQQNFVANNVETSSTMKIPINVNNQFPQITQIQQNPQGKAPYILCFLEYL
jgi:hypothetical protein